MDFKKAKGVRVALINEYNKYLIFYNKKLNTYTGGWVDPGETPDQAAIREELGVEVRDLW